MPATIISHDSALSTLENFIAFYGGFRDFLVAQGWTKTADTGQMSFDTLAAVPSPQQKAIYEIFAFGDGLQASAPIFLKLFYGHNGSNAPRLWAQLGTVTNGAGTLGGSVSSEFDIGLNLSGIAGLVNTYVTAGPSWCALLGPTDANNTGIVFGVERSRDMNGNITAEGASIYRGVMQTASVQYYWTTQFFRRAGNSGPVHYGFITTLPSFSDVTTGAAGADIAISSIIPWGPGPVAPGMLFLAAFRADITNLAEVSVPVYGAPHQYKMIHQARFPLGTAADISLLVRWE